MAPECRTISLGDLSSGSCATDLLNLTLLAKERERAGEENKYVFMLLH